MNYRECLFSAKKQMVERNLSENAAMLLMMEITGKENHDLYVEFEEEIEQEILKEFNEKFARLLTGEPLQHILGYEYFYGHKFIVNEDVLIPRPETEELVANVLAYYDEFFNGQKVDVCDIGTGSGAIAITLKKEEDNFTVTASDISEKAVATAKRNAANLEANVNFLVGDMCEPLIENNIKVDILVSNPPYIPTSQIEVMRDNVLNFEPHTALFVNDSDPLLFYRVIAEKAGRALREGGLLFFEINEVYGEQTCLMLTEMGFVEVECRLDFNDKPRMIRCRRGW